MVSSIQSISTTVPLPATKEASTGQEATQPRPSSQPPAASGALIIEVSRAASVPVYVYRLTDTATGLLLVEIPNDPKDKATGAPGANVDAKA